jgi:hypothetical protein
MKSKAVRIEWWNRVKTPREPDISCQKSQAVSRHESSADDWLDLVNANALLCLRFPVLYLPTRRHSSVWSNPQGQCPQLVVSVSRQDDRAG